MSEKLTDKQQALIDALLLTSDKKVAAEKAGISYSYARTLLAKPCMIQALAEARASRSERTQINADWVLLHLAEMMEADIADIIEDNGGFLPIRQWPRVWRQMLNGVDVQELFAGAGKDRKKIGEVVKIKFLDRLKALGMIGDHIDVQAFNKLSTVRHEKALEDMSEDELDTALDTARAENSPDQAGTGEGPETVH